MPLMPLQEQEQRRKRRKTRKQEQEQDPHRKRAQAQGCRLAHLSTPTICEAENSADPENSIIRRQFEDGKTYHTNRFDVIARVSKQKFEFSNLLCVLLDHSLQTLINMNLHSRTIE